MRTSESATTAADSAPLATTTISRSSTRGVSASTTSRPRARASRCPGNSNGSAGIRITGATLAATTSTSTVPWWLAPAGSVTLTWTTAAPVRTPRSCRRPSSSQTSTLSPTSSMTRSLMSSSTSVTQSEIRGPTVRAPTVAVIDAGSCRRGGSFTEATLIATCSVSSRSRPERRRNVTISCPHQSAGALSRRSSPSIPPDKGAGTDASQATVEGSWAPGSRKPSRENRRVPKSSSVCRLAAASSRRASTTMASSCPEPTGLPATSSTT